jgi:hypothetical protein
MWNREHFNYGEEVGNAIFLHNVDSLITQRKAMFRCVCGNKFISQIGKVKRFETKSCGCLQKKAASAANSRHRLKGHKLYGIWSAMKARCYNKNTAQYKDYGGKGVIVCEEWKNDFISFFRWAMANGWERGLQLDKDTNGGGFIYSPSVCRFVTPKVNSNKRTTSKIIEYNGESKTVSEWADYFGISLKNLYQRMSRGWSFEKCVKYDG